jgi:acyl carrier protein
VRVCEAVFNNSALELSLNSSADEIDEWDSLTHIQLILGIEKEFKVRFSLGELQDLKNIESLVQLVYEKL